MKKLLIRLLILLFPLLIVGGYFVIEDPMKIIHDTKNPVSPGVLMNDRLYQARFIENTKTPYNSFIFGSSRSKAFKTKEWRNYLDSSSICYHMGVNDETLYGMAQKFRFLNKKGFKLKNVFIQIDHRILEQTKNHEAHIFREYYTVSGETASSYYQRFIIAFLKPSFLKEYFVFKKNGQIDNQKENGFLWDPGFDFITRSGDIQYTRYDEALKIDSLAYYKKLDLEHYPRKKVLGNTLIIGKKKILLETIANILHNHHSNYKLIISPNFDLMALHPNDIKELQRIFGKSNVSDLSGYNEFTKSVRNYYEHKHFKPYVANAILKQLYK